MVPETRPFCAAYELAFFPESPLPVIPSVGFALQEDEMKGGPASPGPASQGYADILLNHLFIA
jgi:hypothetical protein